MRHSMHCAWMCMSTIFHGQTSNRNMLIWDKLTASGSADGALDQAFGQALFAISQIPAFPAWLHDSKTSKTKQIFAQALAASKACCSFMAYNASFKCITHQYPLHAWHILPHYVLYLFVSLCISWCLFVWFRMSPPGNAMCKALHHLAAAAPLLCTLGVCKRHQKTLRIGRYWEILRVYEYLVASL